MNASKSNIGSILGVHAKGLNFKKKHNPTNGYILSGFLPRVAVMDLMNNFHVYQDKKGGLAVITPGRLSVNQRNLL
jgi:hypothetical protein